MRKLFFMVFIVNMLGLSEATEKPPTAILGQPYWVSVVQPEVGRVALPLIKQLPFCKEYVCREMDPEPGHSSSLVEYEWFRDDMSDAESEKLLSSLTIYSSGKLVTQVSAHSYLKGDVTLSAYELSAFTLLAQSATGQKIPVTAFKNCSAKLSVRVKSYRSGRCQLNFGNLVSADGKARRFSADLTLERDVTSGKMVSGLDITLF